MLLLFRVRMIVVMVVVVVLLGSMVVMTAVMTSNNACTCNDLPDHASPLRCFSVVGAGSVRVVLGALGFEFTALGGPGRARAAQPRRELVRPVYAGRLDR